MEKGDRYFMPSLYAVLSAVAAQRRSRGRRDLVCLGFHLTSLCVGFMLLCMKRTTLTIEDELFVQLKKQAATQSKSLASLVNDLLRQAMAIQDRREPYRLELEGWNAELQPGVDILDRDNLFDIMDGR